jgi:hypothetical protein
VTPWLRNGVFGTIVAVVSTMWEGRDSVVVSRVQRKVEDGFSGVFGTIVAVVRTMREGRDSVVVSRVQRKVEDGLQLEKNGTWCCQEGVC